MAEIGSAYISLLPSTRGFGRATSSQVNPQLSRSGAAAGGLFGKSMLKGFIAIGAAVKIAQFLGDSVTEAREAQKVAALTNNVIKTTGGVAKISAAQVNRLADALSRKTGIDDEQIASAENLILTFKNVRREGEGLENIFGRASRAAVDLSASGFGDTAGTAKMLGKALNDPIKGLTALGRAGVTFTEQQQDQIKAMVKAGDLLGAQKTILKEVESQVKGAAEAQATNSDKARVALDNLKEQIGTALLPAIDALAGAFANKIAPAISSFITGLQNGSGAGGKFASFINNVIKPAIGGLVDFVQNYLVPAFREALPPVLEGIRTAFNRVKKSIQENEPEIRQLISAAKKIAEVFYTKVVPAVYQLAGIGLKRLGTAIGVTITVVGAMVRWFNTVSGAIRKTIGAVQAGIAAFTAFAVAVRQKVSNVITTVKALPGKVQAVFSGAITILASAGRALIQGLINGLKEKMAEAVQVVRDGLNKIKNMLPGSPIKEGPLKPWNDGSPGRLLMGLLAKGIAEGGKTAADATGSALEKVGKKAKEKISKIRDQLASVRSNFASLVEPIASNFTQGLFDFDTAGAFTANLTTVKGTLTTLLANFKKLIAEGLNPGFLYQLFQSGGPGLINSLAGLSAAEAQSAGALFGQVTSLSDQLGTAVAGATDKGADLENQTVRLEKKLDHLIKAVHNSADRTGDVINTTASRGHSRGRNGGRRAA